MDVALQAELVVFGDEVRAAAIPSPSKQTALWCLEQLPDLYGKFVMTNESRYGDAISHYVQAVLKELVSSKKPGTEAQQLAAGIPDRFRLLHEQLGIPLLHLKSPRIPAALARKTG